MSEQQGLTRREELAANLQAVKAQIAKDASTAGRSDIPTLIVVTKFFPPSDLAILADLGVMDVGENREQELTAKVEWLEAHRPDLMQRPRRHFIGQIQSKKAKHIASLVDVVHSVDRPKLVPLLNSGADSQGRRLDILIQVALEEGSPERGGVLPQELDELADAVAAADALSLKGLMAVAPRDEEPARAFERLARIREKFMATHPRASDLSAGMSGDMAEAIAIGATHLRVGSAILGSRPKIG